MGQKSRVSEGRIRGLEIRELEVQLAKQTGGRGRGAVADAPVLRERARGFSCFLDRNFGASLSGGTGVACIDCAEEFG